MSRLALLLALGVLLTVGCLGLDADEPQNRTTATDDVVPTDAEAASAERPRAEHESTRIVVDVPEAGWQATRFVVTPDLWAGGWTEGEDNQVQAFVALNPTPGTAEAVHVGLAYDVEGYPAGEEGMTTSMFFSADESTPDLVSGAGLSCPAGQCPEEPPRIEMALVVGTSEGSGSLSVGLLPEDPSHEDLDVTGRPSTGWPIEHTGRHIRAGTHIDFDTSQDGGDMTWTAGAIEVEEEAPVPSPNGLQVGAEHRMEIDQALPETGSTWALMSGFDAVEASRWTLDWAVPGSQGSDEGAFLRAGPVNQGFTPLWSLYQEHEPGRIDAQLERVTSGKRDPGLPAGEALPASARAVAGTWGYLDTTYEELYGWELPERAYSTGPLAGSDAEHARLQLCAGPPGVDCFVQHDLLG